MYIIIAGAGLLGSQMTKIFVENQHDVVIIDIDRNACENIYTDTGAMTLHGSATDLKVLQNAGVDKADVLLCLMKNDADNIACALLAKSLGIKRVLACLRKPMYEEAYKIAGVNSIVRMTDLLINQLIMEVEQPKVRKIIMLGGGKAGIYAVKIPPKSKAIGLSIKDIAQDDNFPKECVFMGIYKESEDEFFIPRGNYTIKADYIVFFVSKGQFVKQATDFLTK